MKYLIYWTIIFVIMNIIFYFILVRKYRKKTEKYPSEVDYLIKIYKINLQKINYSRLLRVLGVVNSFIISSACVVVFVIDGFIFQIMVGFLVLIILIIIFYQIIGKILLKKGGQKNGK